MTARSAFGISVGLAAIVTGCVAPIMDEDDEAARSSAAALDAPIHHVLLLSGGFNSCDPIGARGVLPNDARELIAEIKQKSGEEPTVVRTCFGGIGNVNQFDMLVSRGPISIKGGSTSVNALENELESLLASHTPSRLDAYGHSHGGWLVGRVVQDLGPGTADSFTLNVFLSDAISRTRCTPAVVISGVGRTENCGRFPADLSPWQIRANVKGYLGTAYQHADWLHSNAINTADENIFMNPGLPVNVAARNHRALYTLPLGTGRLRHKFEYF